MHTILGAGGPVANCLAKELLNAGEKVRLVSRKPVTQFANAEWVRADLKNAEQVQNAVRGASVIYACAGLQYDKKIWAVEWPLIMQNLIDAARVTGARLIFFDNVYMYGHVQGPMKEDTAYSPSSVKGSIRATIADRLMQEAKAGNIKATIARAADFYGAETLNSFYDSMVLAKFAKGEKAMWLGNTQSQHSFTYVPDAGRAMFLLGQHETADNQVWHLPTAKPLTGKQFIHLAASIFNTNPSYMRVNKLMLQTMGIFNKLISESVELYYQYQYDYIFDSSKFESFFGMKPTAYEQGIKELSKTLFKAEAVKN